jgi:glycosyltransferase involved in cell wall biosynthesis
MNILIVSETYYPFIAGVSSSTRSIAEFMHSRGHKIILIVPKASGFIKDNEPFQIIRTPSVTDPFYKGKTMTPFPLALHSILKAIIKNNIDIIHIQEPGSLGVSGLIAAKITHRPFIGALHFTPDQAVRMLPGKPVFLERFFIEYQKLFYNQCTGIMIPTATFEAYLNKIGVSSLKAVVSNGVNTDNFHPPDFAEKTAAIINKDIKTVEFYYLGRLNKDKNVQAIIAALPKTDENVRIVIAGEGNDRQMLKKQADQLKVGHKIIWLGSLNQEQMLHWYFRSDVFILLALYEIQSIVTLQALACGLPVILANRGALPELVDDGVNGFLINPDQPSETAEKINQLARNPILRQKMGAVSRIMSLKHHKPTVLTALENFYRQITASYMHNAGTR